MSRRTTHSAAMFLACTIAAAPLVAQQDSSMMRHDTGMMQDSTMMDKGKMMDHGQMMDQGSAMGMGANMMFMGAAGQKAAGDYAIVETGGKQQLKLTDDFSVAAGPDLYLVLANGTTPDKGALYLGKLKQATGSQTYDLPKGKDLSTYTTLLVWSKKEKRAVASAEWHMNSGGMMHQM